MNHCIKCGNLLTGKQQKYCAGCGVASDKEKAKERNKRYREKNHARLLLKEQKYRDEHRAEVRLRARNFSANHKEQKLAELKRWRALNPEKYKLQRQKEWKRRKKRLKHRMYANGIYPPKVKKGPVRISICKTCDREIENQGPGISRKYCESCFPQVMALKRVLGQMKREKERPSRFKEWYQNTTEVLVASTCSVCSAIIPYKGKGMTPFLCEMCGPNRELNANRRRDIKRKESKMAIEDFIKREKLKHRLLYTGKKWTAMDIAKEFERWKGSPHPQPISYEEMECEE
jgi:hypothetical protein